MGFVLHAHLVRGESHIQNNANREVATLAARRVARGAVGATALPQFGMLCQQFLVN